ncbi:MFS transporter [Pseudonocardia hierapolitana]|uniref:MFS transporter n=1 Tax=Pseudonocardia hierapolitana TaxID=1128676 RepID=A0A561T1F5_9PSEU|nr:MFS transporter [Pseudonocardia hierapolitana]TWF80943.1 MFS transporter [Pseudonocardia hierapolitana]
MTVSRAATTGSGSRWDAVLVVCLGVVLMSLDMTIVAVALPAIGAELNAPPAVAQWLLLGYSLPVVALSLPAGRWVDRAGPLPAFRLAVGGFGIASALVALAPGIGTLVAARVLQGCAGALIGVVALPLVNDAVRPEHRGRAMSIVLTLIPLAGVAGPALGGLLTDTVGWRTIFLVNLPVVAVALALSGRAIPAVRPGRAGLPRPDRAAVLDTGLLGAGATALVLALSLPADAPLLTAGLLAVAAVTTVAWARRPDARPVLGLLRMRRITPSLVALLATTAGVGAVNLLVPYALVGAGASTTGLVLLVLSAAMAATSPPAGVLADRVGAAPVVVAGAVAVLAGAAWMLAAPVGPLGLVGPLLLIGVGNGLFAGPTSALVLGATPAGMVGAGSGLTALARNLGFTLGPALAAVTLGTAVVPLVLAAIALMAAAAVPRRRTGS